MAPKARQAKGKARLNSYDKLLNEDVKEKEEKLEIFIPVSYTHLSIRYFRGMVRNV